MSPVLLSNLKTVFGTVSSQDETSGVVAVRNITARRRLGALCDEWAREEEVGTNVRLTPIGPLDRFPQLVRLTIVLPSRGGK